MSSFHKASSWRQVLGMLAGCFIILILLFYIYNALKPPFLTTRSPDNTYTVQLFGQKERPALFTVEVGAVVLKNGKPFWDYQTLHTGDFMDLSFELGWPDHRWLTDNILQFYREENFSKLTFPSEFILVNKTENAIRHLRVTIDNEKFLGFDIEPDSEIRLTASPPKGDFSQVSVAIKLDDGRNFENKAVFDKKDISQPIAHSIVTTDEGIEIATEPVDPP